MVDSLPTKKVPSLSGEIMLNCIMAGPGIAIGGCGCRMSPQERHQSHDQTVLKSPQVPNSWAYLLCGLLTRLAGQCGALDGPPCVQSHCDAIVCILQCTRHCLTETTKRVLDTPQVDKVHFLARFQGVTQSRTFLSLFKYIRG
jgi:hypothetical protein